MGCVHMLKRSFNIWHGVDCAPVYSPAWTASLLTDEATGQIIGVTALVCESGTWHGRVAWIHGTASPVC